MDNKRIVKNIGVSLIAKPVSMFLSFIYTPLVLSFLGDEKYGVWAIILNVVSWINYFDIGIGNGLRNKLAEAVANDNNKKAQMYVSTAYIGTVFISCFFCILLTIIWNVFDLSSIFNIRLNDENTDIIVFISVFFVCVNFVISLSKTSAYAIQQPGIVSIFAVLGQFLQVVVLYFVSLFNNENLFLIALIYGTVSLVENIILYFFIIFKYPFLKFDHRMADIKCMKQLFTLGIGFFLMQISSLVLNTTDNLLISKMYGSAEVTPYNIVYKFFYIFVQLHAIIIMPMWSAYTEAAARKEIKWIDNTMKKVNIVTLCISVCVIVGVAIFEPFAEIWLGKQLYYGKGLIFLVAFYMIIQMFANNYSAFLCGVGDIKVATIISVIGGVINIPLSVVFAGNFGMRIKGIILGSLIVMLMNIVVLPIVTYKCKSKLRDGVNVQSD